MHANHYKKLLMMIGLSFVSMYILMYAMVNGFANVFNSINQFYMAGLMTAAMVITELGVMGMMYEDKKKNALIMVGSAVLLVLFFMFIQTQAAVSDKQFLRSMIPHHASAILMCEQASIQDSEIKELCSNIISGQQGEIDEMKAKLQALDNN